MTDLRSEQGSTPPCSIASVLAAGQAISTLLTTESLLFAALGVTVARTSNVKRGDEKPPGFGIAIALSVVLAFVALAAASAWFELYMANGTQGVANVLQALGIAVGIVAQPVIAFMLAWTLR